MRIEKPRNIIEQQSHFMHDLANLILFGLDAGYAITAGDAYRDPRVFGHVGDSKGYGNPSSDHKRRLAMDLNLFVFRDGYWQYCYDTESHRPLGEHWESMGHVWGGRWNDGNHYQY
jgi:hypothetical protein